MEFKHVEYFVETCKYRSMSKAADALFISQQALSRCIAGMEQELGTALFHRSVKGIRLTEFGQQFYNTFAPQVEHYHTTMNEMLENVRTRPVRLQFCCAPLIFRCIDPEILMEFQDAYPHITLEMLELPDADCDAYVEADVSHFGMLAIPENRHGERLPFTLVKTFPLYLFVHKDHPLAKEKMISFAQLKDEPIMMMDKKSYYRKLVNHYSRKYDFVPKAAFESSDASQLISLVNKGRGVALSLLPLYDASIYQNTVAIPFDDPTITWSIAFIHQDAAKLSQAARLFIRFVCEKVEHRQ